MNTNFSNEAIVREYLLGTLARENCDEIEQKLLLDQEFAKFVELVEDEIIDEYLDGSLNRKDTQSVETHFLVPPERQRKIWFARLLRSQLRKDQPVPHRAAILPTRVLRARFYWGIAVGAAVVALVTIPIGFYQVKMRQNLESELAKSRNTQSRLEQELAEGGAKTTDLLKALTAFRNQNNAVQVAFKDSTVDVTLLPLVRGGGIPSVKPHSTTRWIKAHIPLLNTTSESYYAVLRAPDGTELNSLDLKPVQSTGVRQLIYRFPYRDMPPGQYSVTVTANQDAANSPPNRYLFVVSK